MDLKEKWIEEQLNPSRFIGSVPVNDALMQRLKTIPKLVKTNYDRVPKRTIWMAAASIAVLLCINIASFTSYKKAKTETTSQSEVSDPYFSYLKQL